MDEPRLKTSIWLQAGISRSFAEGIPAMVVRRGDGDAGAVLVKINRFDLGCTVLTQGRTGDGKLGWYAGTGPEPVPEAQADAYIAEQVSYDRDLWVVEIEDRDGRHPFGGDLIG